MVFPINSASWIAAMSEAGLNNKYQIPPFGILSAILNLSNLQFDNEVHDGPNSAIIRNPLVHENVSKQLGVDPMALDDVLTKKTQRLNRDRYTAYLDRAGAEARRDDLSRTIYTLLFNWIVEFINSKLSSPNPKLVNCISLVDLPGFQQYTQSNFNEFCTNCLPVCFHASLFLAQDSLWE